MPVVTPDHVEEASGIRPWKACGATSDMVKILVAVWELVVVVCDVRPVEEECWQDGPDQHAGNNQRENKPVPKMEWAGVVLSEDGEGGELCDEGKEASLDRQHEMVR